MAPNAKTRAKKLKEKRQRKRGASTARSNASTWKPRSLAEKASSIGFRPRSSGQSKKAMSSAGGSTRSTMGDRGSLRSLLKPKLTLPQMRMAVEANNTLHLPPPMPLGPYTTVRGRLILPITTSTAGQTTTLLVSAHTDKATAGSRDLTISPIIAISGVGTNAPGTVETTYADTLIATYAAALATGVASAQLHSLTIHVNCTSNANTVEGLVYMGSVSQRMNRTRFPSWGDLGISAINRHELLPMSAFNVLSKPVKLSSYPVDMSDWCSQVPLVLAPVASGDSTTLDTLSQIVLVWPPTSVAVNYSITVFTEWRVNFVDATLASTAAVHTATDMSVWSEVASAGVSTNGFIGPSQPADRRWSSVSESISSAMGPLAAMARMIPEF